MDTSPEYIIQSVYNEIGLDKPRVTHYPSFEDLAQDYLRWKDAASPVKANFWIYQYPVLNPYSYWAQYHLFDEGFQFDLTREANDQGCYVQPTYLSKIAIKPKLLYGRYMQASLDAVMKHQDTAYDQKIASLCRNHGAFLDILQDRLEAEDPANQMAVRDYIFLGGFSWLMIERDILRDMRRWVKKPVCDEHFQNVNALCNPNIVYITFRESAFWVNLFD